MTDTPFKFRRRQEQGGIAAHTMPREKERFALPSDLRLIRKGPHQHTAQIINMRRHRKIMSLIFIGGCFGMMGIHGYHGKTL